MGITLREFLNRNKIGGDIRKSLNDDQILTVDPRKDNAVDSGLFDLTFGNRVWSTLNNQTAVLNLLPSHSAGNNMDSVLGWRLHTDRGASTGPVGETDNLPQGSKGTYIRVGINPNFVSTRVSGSLKHQIFEEVSVGVDDGLAVETENKINEHAVNINFRLVAPAFFPVSGYYRDGGTSDTTPKLMPSDFDRSN